MERNKEKQIEEMAQDMCQNCVNGVCLTSGIPCDLHCIQGNEAEEYYNKGYRKASNLIEEVMEWLEEKGFLNIEVWAIQDVKDELKKKYTEVE